MNRLLVTMIACALLMVSCGNRAQKEVETVGFNELFTEISPEEISDNIFKLVGKDYTVITAGKEEHFNSMTASWGGVGILFNKPVAWGMLRANRYTLEIMKQEETYTLSYFPDEYKEQVLFFGSKSGRDTDKMKEMTLTPIQTPSGKMTYREARLVLECKIMEVTTVSPEDYYEQEAREFVVGGYEETGEYHKLVFGEILGVWVRGELGRS